MASWFISHVEPIVVPELHSDCKPAKITEAQQGRLLYNAGMLEPWRRDIKYNKHWLTEVGKT
jgi:starvation-inducible outer membrane lipoprotein